MLTSLKYEFQWKNFAFRCADPSLFYTSQWTNNRLFFWVVKFVFLSYWLGWFILNLLLYADLTIFWTELTYWGVVTILMYFVASFAVVTYGLFNQSKTSINKRKIQTISPTVEKNDTYERNNNSASMTTATPKKDLRWFHIVVWILYEVSCGVAIIITAMYWSLLEVYINPFSINNHAVNSVIILLDLALNNISVRILHFYHITLFAVVYIAFSLILFGVGFESAIYPVLDWRENTNFAIGLSIAVMFLISPIAHLIIFAIYSLKKFAFKKICKTKKEKKIRVKNSTVGKQSSIGNQLTGKENAGFDVI